MPLAIAVRANEGERAPILESATELGARLPELSAVDIARDGEVGARTHVMNAPVFIHAVRDRCVPIHIVDDRAGPDRFGRYARRKEVRKDMTILVRRLAVCRRGDCGENRLDRSRSIDAVVMVDEIAAGSRAVSEFRE